MTATEAPAPGEMRAVARRFALGVGGRLALALIAAGGLVRLGLILAGWPQTNSDEGLMGLMALHIATGRDFPLFFYGQVYMGTLQAYLGALLFPIFGASVLALRLGLLLLFILFALVMYTLVRLLYGHLFALFTLGLLALGEPDLLKAQLLALGGYPETLLFGALALLLAAWLAISPTGGRDGGRPRGRRLATYAALGMALGLGWWSDPLVLPFLLAAPLPLVLFRRGEPRWRGLGALALGLVAGLAPQIAFLLTHLNDNGPSAVAAFQPQGMATLAQLPGRLFTQIIGTLFVALPNITGAGWVCTLTFNPRGPLADWSGAGLMACAAGRLVWSMGVLALGVIAAQLAWRGWRAAADQRAVADQRAAAIQVGRLTLLVGGALVLGLYTISPQAAGPLGNARYLIGLLIALPALVHPVWTAALAGWREGRRGLAAWAALGLLAVALAGGVAATYAQTPAARADAAANQALVHDLGRLGVRHIYTDYWTCYKTAFLSQERITCDVLSAGLRQAQDNRYPPYAAAVQADPRASYVFPAGSPQAAALARKAADPTWGYTLTRLDGYVVYAPRG